MRSRIPLNRFLLLRVAAIALVAALAAFALPGPPSWSTPPTTHRAGPGPSAGKLTASWTAPTNLGADTVQDYKRQYKLLSYRAIERAVGALPTLCYTANVARCPTSTAWR